VSLISIDPIQQLCSTLAQGAADMIQINGLILERVYATIVTLS